MGNFFTSPQEQASQNLYNSAISGNPVGQSLLQGAYSTGVQNIQTATNSAATGVAGDIASQLASQGVKNSTGAIGKALAPIYGTEQQSIADLGSRYLSQLQNLDLNELSTGLSGLSQSSDFGNIFAGLQTLTGIGSGLTSMLVDFGVLGKKPVTGNTGTTLSDNTGVPS